MNWDDLKIFLHLARFGRVNQAAQHLNLDATTLVRRIKKLEESLNCKLFELTSKGYVLTEDGEHFTQYLEKAEHYLIEAKNSLTSERTDLSGTIRVSVSEGFGSFFLAQRLTQFKHLYPAICIELVSTSGFLNINKREADIAILLEKPTQGLVFTKRLTDYHLQLYTHRQLLDELGNPSDPKSLKHYHHVSYVPDLLYAPQLKFVEETQLSTLHALRSTSITAQFQMLTSGAGLGILPQFIARQSPNLVPVLTEEINIKRTFWLATHKDVRPLARINVFLDWLTHTIEEDRHHFIGDM